MTTTERVTVERMWNEKRGVVFWVVRQDGKKVYTTRREALARDERDFRIRTLTQAEGR